MPQLLAYVEVVNDLAVDTTAAPRVTEFLSSTTMLPAGVDVERIRTVFTGHPR